MRTANSTAFILNRLMLLALVLSLSLVPASLSAQSGEPTATPTYPTAVVIVSALNVRSGPGTTFAQLAKATSGDVLSISGKNSGCTWISVTTEEGMEGWVSANARFVKLDTPCERISLTGAAGNAAAPESSATPAPAPTATASLADIPKGKGCIDFGNWTGPELIISGSLPGTNEIFDLNVKNKTVERICLWPGEWGVTISAIANGWGDLVREITIVEGEVLDFPLVRR